MSDDLRERAACDLWETLMKFGRYDNVRQDGDRVTYVLHGQDAITLIVLNALQITAPMANGACPFCGSTKPFHIKPADDTTTEQRGCLDCDRWIDPVRLVKP